MKSLCTVGLGYENTVILLILIIIISESLSDSGVDLLDAHTLDVLYGKKLSHRHMVLCLTLISDVPEWSVEIVTSVKHGDERNLITLNEHSDGIGNIRVYTAGGVSRLGIHTEYISALEHSAYGLNKVHICRKLTRRDSSDKLEKPRTAVIAVNIYNVVHSVWEGRHSKNFKIYEMHMVR